MSEKARVSFCWHCGKRLANYKIYEEIEIEGHTRVVHKKCSEYINDYRLEPEDDEEEEDPYEKEVTADSEREFEKITGFRRRPGSR